VIFDMHVDGAREVGSVASTFIQTKYPHAKWKLTPVFMSIAGSQRDQEMFKQTYPIRCFLLFIRKITLTSLTAMHPILLEKKKVISNNI
jgi:hypothetical protein